MPIYEYRCADCGHELEAMQKISAAPLTDCPACQDGRLRKKISPVAFRLKGSGWYETDFKSGQQRNVAAADGGKQDNGGAKDQADGDAAKPTANGKGGQAKDGKPAADGGKGAAAEASKPAAKPSKESSKSE